MNRVVLSLYQNLTPHENSLPSQFWTQLHYQAHLRLSVRTVFNEELAAITGLLEERGVRWILIKSVRSFPREIRDLDILVFDDSVPQLTEVLRQIGYAVSEKWSGNKMGLKAYRKSANSIRVPVSIDVHSRLGYEGLTFADEEDIWGSRGKWDCNGVAVPIPAPQHQLLAMTLNSFFGDGGLRLSDVFEAISLMKQRVDLVEVFKHASKYGWTRPVQAVLSSCFIASQSLGLYSNEREIPSQMSPTRLPSYFGLGTLTVGLLEKGLHDLSAGGSVFLSSWARLGMKYVSSLSRDRLLRDSWNEIFQR